MKNALRNINEIKRVGAEVYYRDERRNGEFGYVRGRVLMALPVTDAERRWGQTWKHVHGTILEIQPLEEVDDDRVKYRHTSAVLHPAQYDESTGKRKIA